MKKHMLVVLVLVAVLSIGIRAQEAFDIQGAEMLADYPAILFVTEMMAGHFDDVVSLDIHDQYLADQFVFSEPGHEDQTSLNFLTGCHTWNQQVPDYAVTVTEVVPFDDVVVVRYAVAGTHEENGAFAYEPVVFFYMNGEQVQRVWMMYDRCQQGTGTCELSETEYPNCIIKQW
jgi:hypothetical protein